MLSARVKRLFLSFTDIGILVLGGVRSLPGAVVLREDTSELLLFFRGHPALEADGGLGLHEPGLGLGAGDLGGHLSARELELRPVRGLGGDGGGELAVSRFRSAIFFSHFRSAACLAVQSNSGSLSLSPSGRRASRAASCSFLRQTSST